jgi:hypothetical protein
MKNIICNENEELRMLIPPYMDIAKMYDSLTELYKAANDKTVIDEIVKQISMPMLTVVNKK